ncbi:MAG: hypothetical protein Q4F72_01975 [Desulfovibrionaceae bacterium]|nr:hypothetical protein [Desulfovibrionaceae bacterium]
MARKRPRVGTAGRTGRPAASALRVLLVSALCGLAGCALSDDAAETPSPARPPMSCTRLYTYAPGFLVVDVAAGSSVILNPEIREFPVFCSAADAHAHLVGMVSMGHLPRGDWSVYALEGGPNLAVEKAPGEYALAAPAQLAEWIADTEYNPGSLVPEANLPDPGDAAGPQAGADPASPPAP